MSGGTLPALELSVVMPSKAVVVVAVEDYH